MRFQRRAAMRVAKRLRAAVSSAGVPVEPDEDDALRT